MRLQRIINLRMSGEDVRWMQTKLKEHGFFKEKITGYFCQNTLVSVNSFQKTAGLKANGVVGSQTWIHLNNFGKKIEVKDSSIPNKISFVSDSGLTIYDNLLSDDEFYKEETDKNTIFIHNTNSCSKPDWRIGNWDKRYEKDNMGFTILEGGQPKQLKTGSHYVIGRKSSSCDDSTWDGKILKAIDDKYHINHIEAKSSNIKDLNSKSISIEICNYGHLNFRNDQFYNIVNKPIKDSEVVELSNPYRGYKYWERYTDHQIESLRKLILHLKSKWNISIEADIYDESWFNYSDKWLSLGGLRNYSQINEDVFGIFPQKEMIEMLNSL